MSVLHETECPDCGTLVEIDVDNWFAACWRCGWESDQLIICLRDEARDAAESIIPGDHWGR